MSGPYTYPLQTNPDLSREQQQVFGVDAVLHEVTGLPLEMGSGALPPDDQARLIHLQVIHATKGPAAAAAMLAKLNAKDAATLARLKAEAERDRQSIIVEMLKTGANKW
jgi:hypothetical protein